MIKQSTVLDYSDDDLLAFVDRRVGNENYAPLWDQNDAIDIFKTKARRGGTAPIFRGGGGGPGGNQNRDRLRTAIAAKHGQAVVKVISYGKGKRERA